MLESLVARLKEARYDGQREKIQAQTNQVRQTHESAIKRIMIDDTLYEARRLAYEKEQADLSQEIAAAEREEHLAKYIQAGGKAENFDRDWPSIERSLIESRMLPIILGEQKPPVPIDL